MIVQGKSFMGCNVMMMIVIIIMNIAQKKVINQE